MKDCQDFQERIQSYIEGEIAPSEFDSLRRHALECPDCRQLMDVHIGLLRAGDAIPEPDAAGLEGMQRGVWQRISGEGRRRPRRGFLRELGMLLGAHPAPAMAAVLVLIVGAVFLGRWSIESEPFEDNMLLSQVNRQAQRQAGLEGYWDTPFTYSNVSARPVSGGDLDLSFDVSRRVKVVTSMDSPLAKDVLLHAIINPTAMGTQMKAMELTSRIGDPKLKEAIVFTLHNDPNLAVRIEAINVLASYPYDDTVRDALLKTLREDKEVQMRLLALEHLAGKHVNLDTLEKNIKEAHMESDPAVLQHAIELTKDM
jgi:hypothetical protein